MTAFHEPGVRDLTFVLVRIAKALERIADGVGSQEVSVYDPQPVQVWKDGTPRGEQR